MALTDDLTTLICLFHHQDHAEAAFNDITRAGVPATSITRINGHGSEGNESSSLAGAGVPERDQQHLLEGLRNGGVILAVRAAQDLVGTVEKIFGEQDASKIDEIVARPQLVPAAPVAAAGAVVDGERAIPIVEEELVVGKRTVDQGGVRVFRRVVEIPVTESVNLREEHVKVERRPVDRAATDSDLALQGDRTIELTETAEEVVVGKNARVVEEVLVGKESSERVQHVQDTVRRTEVEVEQVGADDPLRTTRRDA